MKIKSLRCTCDACPSQWEGITEDNESVYIRYRWGRLAIRVSKPNGTIEDAVNTGKTLYDKQISNDEYDGVIDIEEVMERLKRNV